MRLSARITFWLALPVAMLCAGYGLYGLSMIDASRLAGQELEDARGFAWFWLFLGGVTGVIALLSLLMARGRLGADRVD